IQSQIGKDLRVFVIGKKIIAAVLRVNNNDLRANFKLGRSAFVYHITIEEVEMINKIINNFDYGLVGIDFLIDIEGNFHFNEIEDMIGSRILSDTTNINLLSEYKSYIKLRILYVGNRQTLQTYTVIAAMI